MRDLVLLPGWAMPETALSALLPLLERECRVTVLALPRGDSLPAIARAALAVAPPVAAWFGWSLGGMVATQAALQSPSRVPLLATLASSLSFVVREGWPHAMPAAVFEGFAARFAADPVSARRRFLALQAQGSATERDDLRTLRGLPGDRLPPDGGATWRDGLSVLGSADLRAAVGALACPSLWLYGGNDALVPAAVAPDVARHVPGAHTQTLPGGGHAPFLHDPRSVADAVLNFLAEHP